MPGLITAKRSHRAQAAGKLAVVERFRALLVPVLAALAWAGLLALVVAPVALLFTLPVFLIAAPLAIGRYPALKLATRPRSPRVRRRAAVDPAPVAGDHLAVASLHLAGARFVRGPPSRRAAA